VPDSGEEGTLHGRVQQDLLFIKPLISSAVDGAVFLTDTEGKTKRGGKRICPK